MGVDPQKQVEGTLPLSRFLSLPVEVGPLNPARGSGVYCKLPSGVWGGAPAEIIWCILALKSGVWRQQL